MRIGLLRIAAAIFLTYILAAGQEPKPSPSPGDELPAGEGKTLLQAACTSCHDLKEVTKFKGYYGIDEWTDVVRTMVEYGARLDDAQSATLVEYLAKYLGPKSNEKPQ
jgi:virginiamycin B lyase